MSFACHQQICPHMHFNKCLAQRIRSIPVTIFPDPTIDSFTNINVKCGRPYKSNISTVAYQKFVHFHEETNDERNFIKDFYMENYQKTKMLLNNNIVNQQKEQMYRNSAYVLAQGATKDYDNFENNRKRALTSAQNRAQSALKAHINHKKQERQHNYDQNGYWLKKLFRKLQQVANSIINGNGQDAAQRQKLFLMSKSNLTANFLSKIKIANPKNAFGILEQLRILMQKKKLKFSDARQQQQMNKSVSMSYTSDVSQNTSQGSMISQATSNNQSKMDGEDEIVGKFWDFNQLKKKWHLSDIQDVKVMIRRILTKSIVFDAQLKAVKQRRDAQIINKQILKNKLELNPESKNRNDAKSDKKNIKKANGKVKSIIEKNIVSLEQKSLLTKKQEEAKTKIIEGGRFDAIGQKFERNRTYSLIFKQKQNQIQSTLIQKPAQISKASLMSTGKTLTNTKVV